MPRRKKIVEEPVVTVAPTSPRSRSMVKFVAVIFLIGLIVVSGSIYLGKSDTGAINVAATIQEANRNAVDENGNPINQIATTNQEFQRMPNGGLVAQENQNQTPPPQEIPQPETGTSTGDGTSTTTPEASTEGGGESTGDTENTETTPAENGDQGGGAEAATGGQ